MAWGADCEPLAYVVEADNEANGQRYALSMHSREFDRTHLRRPKTLHGAGKGRGRGSSVVVATAGSASSLFGAILSVDIFFR